MDKLYSPYEHLSDKGFGELLYLNITVLVCWLGFHVTLFIRGRRDRFLALPLPWLVGTSVLDLYFGYLNPLPAPLASSCRIWLVLDLCLVFVYLSYPRHAYQGNRWRMLVLAAFCFTVACIHAGQNEFGKNAFFVYTVALIQPFTSFHFLWNLLLTASPRNSGHSVATAVFKTAGNVTAFLMLHTVHPYSSLFPQIGCLTVLVDFIYLGFCLSFQIPWL